MSSRLPLAGCRIGLCPIGKFVFSHQDALRQKAEVEARLRAWGVDAVGIDDVVPDGVVRSQADVAPVVDHLRRADVRGVFMPHCNFGTEGAVGMIGARLGVPVLLWGPRDEAPMPDGTRLRDTLCGLFASSKVLRKLGVPFTYIENCRIGEPAFQRGVDTFVRAAHAADALRRGTRIGLLGQRIDFFWTTIINESELLERFHVEVLPLDLVQFIRRARERAAAGRARYEVEVDCLRAEADVSAFAGQEDALVNVLAARDQMLALADDHGLEGLAIQDFDSLIEEMGAYCMFADAVMADRLGVGLESDVHGALSCVLARRAALGAGSAFLTDVTVRHPTNDNAVLAWHAGAPLSMRDPASRVRLGTHWILPSPLPGMTHYRLKQGEVTFARFDGDRGEYRLAVGEGITTEGPETLNNYVWVEVDDWPRWERALIEGPFIHHMAMAYGRWADALQEACRYVPGLEPVRLDAPGLQPKRRED